MAVGVGPIIATSDDGSSWTIRHSEDLNQYLFGVASDGIKLVATGGDWDTEGWAVDYGGSGVSNPTMVYGGEAGIDAQAQPTGTAVRGDGQGTAQGGPQAPGGNVGGRADRTVPWPEGDDPQAAVATGEPSAAAGLNSLAINSPSCSELKGFAR